MKIVIIEDIYILFSYHFLYIICRCFKHAYHLTLQSMNQKVIMQSILHQKNVSCLVDIFRLEND